MTCTLLKYLQGKKMRLCQNPATKHWEGESPNVHIANSGQISLTLPRLAGARHSQPNQRLKMKFLNFGWFGKIKKTLHLSLTIIMRDLVRVKRGLSCVTAHSQGVIIERRGGRGGDRSVPSYLRVQLS